MTKQEHDIEVEMLKGNINRMCITDDVEELKTMFDFAVERLINIRNYNFKRMPK